MPYDVREFEATPNPNAVKCHLDRRIADAPRSFRCAQDAADDPVASLLFRINGVTNVLLLDDWATVGKAPDAKWAGVKRGVRAALKKAP